MLISVALVQQDGAHRVALLANVGLYRAPVAAA
jgi:hypothetical protein